MLQINASASARQCQIDEMPINQVGGFAIHRRSISSDANYLNFFLKYGHFEREREREREKDVRIVSSLSTNNEAEFSYLKYSNFTPQC